MAQTGTKRSKVKKGDQVVVMAGKDRGKRGRVLEVKPAEGKVKVEGVGVVKRHQRANPGANKPGGIIEREAYVDISNVQLIDPASGKPTRVRYDVGADGSKTRVAAGSGQGLDKQQQ
jgi:large subunit ribosomal protein L24